MTLTGGGRGRGTNKCVMHAASIWWQAGHSDICAGPTIHPSTPTEQFYAFYDLGDDKHDISSQNSASRQNVSPKVRGLI